jgi:hypothetical protein
MHGIARFVCLAAVTFAVAVQAQSVISAHSGTIHYVEGKVLLNDQEISPRFGEFPAMDNGAVLKTTAEGRVEVLLVPGAILRLGESSSIRMVSNSLTDTRVELQSGKAVVECDEIIKGDAVTLMVGGKPVSLLQNGIYEAKAQPAAVQVYKGEATLLNDGQLTMVKRGHELLAGDAVTAQKFDDNGTDDLYNWSSRRSGYLALANVSAARTAGDDYGSYAGMGTGFGYMAGGWMWNPAFGMFTMVPMDGMLYSPFGYGYFSPGTVYYAPYYYGAVGGNAAKQGSNSRLVSSSSGASSSATPVTSSRVSGSGGLPASGGGFSTGLARGGGTGRGR